jgi:hypothetical protein
MLQEHCFRNVYNVLYSLRSKHWTVTVTATLWSQSRSRSQLRHSHGHVLVTVTVTVAVASQSRSRYGHGDGYGHANKSVTSQPNQNYMNKPLINTRITNAEQYSLTETSQGSSHYALSATSAACLLVYQRAWIFANQQDIWWLCWNEDLLTHYGEVRFIVVFVCKNVSEYLLCIWEFQTGKGSKFAYRLACCMFLGGYRYKLKCRTTAGDIRPPQSDTCSC